VELLYNKILLQSTGKIYAKGRQVRLENI